MGTHRRRGVLARSAAVAALLGGAVGAAAPVAPAGAATGSTAFVASTVGAAPSAASLDRALPAGVRVTSVVPLGDGLARVTVRGTLGDGAAAAAGDALAATPAIGSAAPAARTRIAGAVAPVSTHDPVFRYQWDLWDAASNLRAGGYGIDAPRAWERTQGSRSVVVAVLDTGITDQRDLQGIHRVPGYDFVTDDPASGIDSGDGDG
ncbi:MAG: hypothetical protein ACTHJL_02105, partial [Amnibacterium sp.]